MSTLQMQQDPAAYNKKKAFIQTTLELEQSIYPDADATIADQLGIAYDIILEKAQGKLSITTELIAMLHQNLFDQKPCTHPGQYRNDFLLIRETSQPAPDPSELPHLMNHYADQIMCSRFSLQPIELAAMAHRRFLDISPFSSGNGHIARLLMNLILLQSGHPAICIAADQKELYLKALSLTNRLNESDPFTEFIVSIINS